MSPHFLIEPRAGLAVVVPDGIVEHLPRPQAITRASLVIEDGYARPPDVPGIGIGIGIGRGPDDHRVTLRREVLP